MEAEVPSAAPKEQVSKKNAKKILKKFVSPNFFINFVS
jgi:hypothetical protein